MLRLRSQPATEGHLGLVMPWQEMREAQPKDRPKVIPTPSHFLDRISPIFPPFFFPRFLRVFTVSPRRFQRAPSRNPGPRNSRHEGQEGNPPLRSTPQVQ